ncbi:transposase [Collinsella aerofaciens]|nr:transposase [Collinsella aerofaciens]MDB1864164.1 transposase [Collinsella aerofaciens]MEE0213366.1 transposase [Collinsella sp.]
MRRRRPFELTYLGFPRERRKWIRTDNVQERAGAEIERRTKAVSVFPSAE